VATRPLLPPPTISIGQQRIECDQINAPHVRLIGSLNQARSCKECEIVVLLEIIEYSYKLGIIEINIGRNEGMNE